MAELEYLEEEQDTQWKPPTDAIATSNDNSWKPPTDAVEKKNQVGNVLKNGTTPTSQSKSQLPSIFQEGTNLTNNNAFKQIGKQIPPELQQRHDEITNRITELNKQPKPENQTPLQKFDNMAAPLLGFNRDITESVSPKKRGEIDQMQAGMLHDVNGHWGNIVGNVLGQFNNTALKLASGGLSLATDLKNTLQNPISASLPSGATSNEDEPMNKLIVGLNGLQKQTEQYIGENPLPSSNVITPDTKLGKVNSYLGTITEALSSFAPDLAATIALPETKVAQGASALQKVGSFLANPFTKYLATKGAISDYGQAKQEGKSIPQAAVSGLKGGAEGAKTGIELALLGAGSGMATNAVMRKAEQLGLAGTKAIATRQLVGLSSDIVAYGLLQSELNSLTEEGKFATAKQIADGIGIAAAFRIKHGASELSQHRKLNKAIEETQNQRQGVAMANFVDADHEAIKTVYDQPETAQELNLQALDAAKKAKETSDLSKKQEYVAKAITLTKASNVKSVADLVLNNPQALEDFKNNPDIPDAVKEPFLKKAQEITDLLKPKTESSTTENVPLETVPDGNIEQPTVLQQDVQEAEQQGQPEQITKPIELSPEITNPEQPLTEPTPSNKIKTESGNVIERDVESEKIRGDEGHRLYQIKDSNGKRLGSISLNERNDLGGYQIEVATVFNKKQGTGKDAYKSLIKSLDKPLISDSSLTADAKGLWESLVKDGYAKYDKEAGKYISIKPIEQTPTPSTVKSGEGLKDIESTVKALDKINEVDKIGFNNLIGFADPKVEKVGIKIPIADINETNLYGQKLSDAVDNVKNGHSSKEVISPTVYEENGKYIIVDGFHRIAKAKLNGESNIKVDIVSPDTNKISELYHKAKADGSNPEFVKEVENLINKNETTQDTKQAEGLKDYDTSQVYYRGSENPELELKESEGHDHFTKGVSTTKTEEYAKFHGDNVKKYYGKKGDFIEYFDLVDRYEKEFGTDDWTGEELSNYGKKLGFVGSRLNDPNAGVDYRFFDASSLKEVPAKKEPIKQKITVVEDRNDTPINIDDIGEGFVLHRGSKDGSQEGFNSLQSNNGYGYDKGSVLVSSVIKKGAKVLKLVEGNTENYKNNENGINEFYKIVGDKLRNQKSEWLNEPDPSDITQRLWGNKAAVEKLRKAGVDIVIGNTIDGVDAFIVNKDAVEKYDINEHFKKYGRVEPKEDDVAANFLKKIEAEKNENYKNNKQAEAEKQQPEKLSDNSGTAEEGKITEPTDNGKEPPIEPPTDNTFMYEGSKKQRELGLLNHLMNATEIPEGYKNGLKEKGLDYEVSNQYEAAESAKGVINSIGRNDAMEAARTEMVDPSVGSAIYGESLNQIFNEEQALRAEGKNAEADILAKEWSDTSYEYAQLSNKKGKWNAQIAYFYKTSPMGFVMRIKEAKAQQFEEWFKNKEEGYKEVFDELLKGEEGQALLKEEVEKIRIEERVAERAAKKEKVHKSIDDWADKWIDKLTPKGTKGVQKQGIGVPEIIKTAADVAKKAYDAGIGIEKILQDAVKYVSEKLETENWDKAAFQKELSERLKTGGVKTEKTETQLLEARIKDLEKQISDYNKLIEEGGGRKNKPKEEQFKDNEKVAELVKERDRLRKENEKLVREATSAPKTTSEEALQKRIAKLEEELDRVTFRRSKEKVEKGTAKDKEITQREKELKEDIEKENEKWDAEIDNARAVAKDYQKLETERNRQLKRVTELKDKLDVLLAGELPETKKNEVKVDTPEIESLKSEIKVAEKSVRESIAHENKLKRLEKELDRLKERKKREKNTDDKKELTEDESAIRQEIEAERLAWKIEDNIGKLNEELERVKNRKEKETEPNNKRKLTQEEQSIKDQIKAENERWAKELEPARKAASEIKRKLAAIKELNRRIEESDYSKEAYQAKKQKTELDKELDKVKEAYNEARKTSQEYIDKKAKQYLNGLRKRLSGLNEKQKEDIVRRSIKKIIDNGGLQYDEFKDIVSDVMGIKNLTPENIKRIEELTEQANSVDQKELDFLNNPTKETLKEFKIAKQAGLQADRELFELTHNEPDIIGTVKSIATLNLLGVPTLIKNYAQNVIYQGVVRFPTSVVITASEKAAYYSSVLSNRFFGTKLFKPTVELSAAQQGYFKEYNEGIIRGWNQMIKGVDEKDYFAKNQYASTLNPSKSLRDLKSAIKGDLFLTTAQKIDKGIQATLGWQPYAISRGMIYGDKPPRYAAQGAAAIQIAHTELNIKDPVQMEAFILSPEKYSYNQYIKEGKNSKQAGELSKGVAQRIIDAGAKATFQNENYLNDFLSKIDEWAKVGDKDKAAAKVIKPVGAIGKALTLPFIKTPANIMWAYFKMANPTLTLGKSIAEEAYAKNRLSKGDIVGYREYQKKAKESFATAVVGYGFTLAAVALAQKGLIRTSNDEDDKARESAGESFFGKDNELNLGKLLGSDDMWVDLSWFSAVGTILDTQARIIEDKKAKGKKDLSYDYVDDFLSTLKYSASASMNTLVFDQGAKTIDALRKGGSYFDYWATQTFNTVSNMFTGGTFPAISKALLPEKSNLKADNLVDQIMNNQKQRNLFVRWAAGYPTSKISMWGEPIKNDNSVKGVMNQMLGFEQSHANKFGAILYDDQQRTGRNEFFPTVEDYKVRVNGKDVPITVEQKRDLDIFIGTARKSLISPFVYDKAYIPGYNNVYSKLNDDDKIDALSVIYKKAKEAGFSKFKEKYKQYNNTKLSNNELLEKREDKVKKRILNHALPKN
jgi:hypothetical protein